LDWSRIVKLGYTFFYQFDLLIVNTEIGHCEESFDNAQGRLHDEAIYIRDRFAWARDDGFARNISWQLEKYK
jgi:hypothetical protein